MRRALLAMLAAIAAPVAAQPKVVSPAPEAVSVTVYRAPSRSAGGEMELDWLDGYALISETRTVALPAGPSEIRFEGVAGGIIPASAIVAGLPDGVGEKNRDARLISPGTLVDAALGRRVRVRRTDRATGRVTESEAILRAGPDGVVMQTPDGVEALRCSGLPETLVFPELPESLSAKPTLAVKTRSAAAATATLRLSYLATGFDWQANYIASVAPDGRTLDLFAWLTLANGNDESFVDASTQAVAGKLNRDEEEDSEPAPVSSQVLANCWPRGTTSDIPLTERPVVAETEYFQQGTLDEGGDIVVTGSRIPGEKLNSLPQLIAQQEELGDLKLYRIPEPVTVAAHAQKQVALLTRTGVPFDRFYGITLSVGFERYNAEPQPAQVILRTRNVAERGLGLPLPAGPVVVYEQVEGRPMVVGETQLDDGAVGQEIEMMVGDSPGVQVVLRPAGEPADKGKDEDDEDDEDRDRSRRYEIEISNANDRDVIVEVTIRVYGSYTLVRPSRKLGLKDGRHFWLARVPANGRTTLAYTRKPDPRPKEDEEEDADADEDGEG